MQILVLGMHRSGTSAVSRVLNMMGAYFGPEGISTGFGEQNPKGFWERRDVRKLTDQILHAQSSDWWKPSTFDPSAMPPEARDPLRGSLRELVHSLDANRPWFLKDPRLCLELPLWLEELECPVIVLCYRQPLQVASSLRVRNGFPLAAGIALWERYLLDALRFSAGLPRVLVQHLDLLEEPVATVRRLLAGLEAAGVRGLHEPSEVELTSFIDPKLFRQREGDERLREWLTPFQLELHERLAAGSLEGPFPERPSAGAADALKAFEEERSLRREREVHEKSADAEREHAREREVVLEHHREVLAQKVRREKELEVQVAELVARASEADASEARLAGCRSELVACLARQQEDAERLRRLRSWIKEVETSYDLILGSRSFRLAKAASQVFRGITLRKPQQGVRQLVDGLTRRGRGYLEESGNGREA